MNTSGFDLTLQVSDALIEKIAERAASIVLGEIGTGLSRSPYLTASEAAERLRTKPQRIYDLLSSGRLTRFKDGSRVLLSPSEIDAYLADGRRSPVAPRLPRTSQSRSRRGVAV